MQGKSAFSLEGELDLATAPQAADVLFPRALSGAELVLDVEGLSFLDSTGLNLLVQLLGSLGAEGRITLLRPRPFLRRLFRVSGLDRHPGLILRDDSGPSNGQRRAPDRTTEDAR